MLFVWTFYSSKNGGGGVFPEYIMKHISFQHVPWAAY